MEKIEKLRPSEFARRVGCHPSKITLLKSKLNKTFYGDSWLVHVDNDNLRHFKNTKLDVFGQVTTTKDFDYLIIEIKGIKDNTIQTQINILSIVKAMYKKEYPIICTSQYTVLGNLKIKLRR